MRINNKGVSLVELVVVLVLVVIVAAAAAIRMGAYDTIKLNAASQKIADDIRYAQALAMTGGQGISGGRAYELYFDVANEKYEVDDPLLASWGGLWYISPLCCDPDYRVEDPLTKEPFIIDFKTGDYKGINIEMVDFDTENSSYQNLPNIVFFDTFGVPFAAKIGGGYPYLYKLTQGQIKITYKGQSRCICVMPETGRACVKSASDCSSACDSCP